MTKSINHPPSDLPSRAEEERRVIEQTHAAIVLTQLASKTFAGGIGPIGFKSLVDGILGDVGATSDPLEKMFVEQLAWCHFATGSLFGLAADAESAELTQLYISATARLMGEYRRNLLALKDYRSGQVARQSGSSQPHDLGSSQEKIDHESGTTTTHGALGYERRQPATLEKTDCQSVESAKTRRGDARRAKQVA